MEVQNAKIKGLKILKPKVYEDERGFFLESFNQKVFEEKVEANTNFVQDNHSKKNILRGLHLQTRKPQGKLIRVTEGKIFDVAVDCRADSETFGQAFGLELSSSNQLQVWLPPGLAHGFLTLSSTAQIQYKATAFYDPEYELSINWNCPEIGIEWPIGESPILSEKDANGVGFAEAARLFNKL